MTWWTNLVNWIKSIGKNPIVKKFWSFLQSLFSQELALIMQKLTEFAIEACGELEATDLTSAEKRAQAFAKIQALAVKAGLAVTSSMINLAIEIAVQAFKRGTVKLPAKTLAAIAKRKK